MNNIIETWAQGYFVDQPQYRHWSAEAKADANCEEARNVRPSPTGNAICRTSHPDAAEWIAQRLNLAAKLEALANKLHTAEAMNDRKEWIACIDAIYRTAHTKATGETKMGREVRRVPLSAMTHTQCEGCGGINCQVYEPTPGEIVEYEAELAEAKEAYSKPPCQECGAMTPEEAETKCRCGGDKDDCHGCKLWPD